MNLSTFLSEPDVKLPTFVLRWYWYQWIPNFPTLTILSVKRICIRRDGGHLFFKDSIKQTKASPSIKCPLTKTKNFQVIIFNSESVWGIIATKRCDFIGELSRGNCAHRSTILGLEILVMHASKKFWFWQNRPYVVHPLTLADVKWNTY